MLHLVEAPSPNQDARPGAVDLLLLHYTGMRSGAAAVARLRDPVARVSSHYVVDVDGTVYRLVAEDRRAFHAGISFWDGDEALNGRSIGIEIVNPGHQWGGGAFPEGQMAAVECLCLGILDRHKVPPHRVVGHSDVAPDRKQDPGERFDWQRLAARGIGLWPAAIAVDEGAPLGPGSRGPAVAGVRGGLARYGYRIDAGDAYDTACTLAVTAFQRHFRPARVDGVADGETRAVLGAVLAEAGRTPLG